MANSILTDVEPASRPHQTRLGEGVVAWKFMPAMRALLWVGGFLLALWLCVQWGMGTSVRNDFTQNVWLPARLVLDGANPYDAHPSEVDVALGEHRSAFDSFNSGSRFYFIYPLWVALVMAPFGAMPLAAATALWRALNLVLLVWGLAAILRASNPLFRQWQAVAVVATVFTVLLGLVYRESILTLYLGQFAIIELGLLAGVWGWLIRSSGREGKALLLGDALVGVALAVLATKPQAVGLPVALIVLWALFRRRLAIPASAAIAMSLLILGPVPFYPDSVKDWLWVIFGGGQAGSQTEVSASVWGLSYQWLGEAAPWRVVAAILSLLGVALLLPRWWRDLRDKASPMPLSLPLTICMNSIVSPYMLGYEHVLLLMPALVLLAAAGLPGKEPSPEGIAFRDDPGKPGNTNNLKWTRISIYLWLAILPYIVVVAQAATQREYPAILQSIPMVVLCWKARLYWRTKA